MAKKKSVKKAGGKKTGIKSQKNKKVKKLPITKKTTKANQEKRRQIDPKNKILKNILIFAGIVILVIVVSAIWKASQEEFEYRGVEFRVVEFCDAGPPCLVTYNTKLPVTYEGKDANYNFYLRNDPRELEEKVDFDGELNLKQMLDLNITYGRSCEGYSSVGVDNLARLIGVSGIEIFEAGNESDVPEDSIYLMIQEGNETIVSQTGPYSYKIDIKECEILEGTERFMIEMFVDINNNLIR